ncbi:hypothetical protein BDZ91DRAFT_775225 [Kalaharituber pfeilii]|nr:hypothetical protein BDZ91DRAFT_775225 [Kalaharituber pfeilii]
MHSMLSNPNWNSSVVMRADVIYDSLSTTTTTPSPSPSTGITIPSSSESLLTPLPQVPAEPELGRVIGAPVPMEVDIRGFRLQRTIVRKFIPRNPGLDGYLYQTCLFFTVEEEEEVEGGKNEGEEGDGEEGRGKMVIYLPHVKGREEVPFYHPGVEGVGFILHPGPGEDSRSLHDQQEEEEDEEIASRNRVSIHFLPFLNTTTTSTDTNPTRLPRTLHHLLWTLTAHAHGLLTGYVKRVTHDALLPRSTLQDTYLRLKFAHAKRLIDKWVESTNPRKHVFEDLLIAAWLMGVWEEMYYFPEKGETEGGQKRRWTGFVDIGCGNGVLVDILRREGYNGWGFDARRRKTWDVLLASSTSSSPSSSPSDEEPWLREMLLVPQPVLDLASTHPDSEISAGEIPKHNGLFPPSTFLISNHSDQLTGWTPILAALSSCPFLAIPCCSYDLGGSKFRAGTYKGLCTWTEMLAQQVGWKVEREVLRMPSTRNVGLVGREMVVVVDGEVGVDVVEERVRRVWSGGGVGGEGSRGVMKVKGGH